MVMMMRRVQVHVRVKKGASAAVWWYVMMAEGAGGKCRRDMAVSTYLVSSLRLILMLEGGCVTVW